MHWYCRVNGFNGEWNAYCVWAPSEYRAIRKLTLYLIDVEGFSPDELEDVTAEMWNTFEHGDFNDYEVLS